MASRIVLMLLGVGMNESTVPPVIHQRGQKLVSIYLDNSSYAKGKTLVGSFANKHGLVEEHLAAFIADGWRVVNLQAFGGGSDGLAVRGWVVALLEKG